MKSICSRVALELHFRWLVLIMLGCGRWWKLEELEPTYERLVSLKWTPLTKDALLHIHQELETLARKVQDSEHPRARDQAEELRWVARWTNTLQQRWIRHRNLCT